MYFRNLTCLLQLLLIRNDFLTSQPRACTLGEIPPFFLIRIVKPLALIEYISITKLNVYVQYYNLQDYSFHRNRKPLITGHFRVPKTLTSKTRLRAKHFLCK